MTFVEKHRLDVGRTDQDRLKVSWEGEIFGVGMMEAMAETYPEYADEHTACATMEWFNIHYIEDFAHEAGVHVSLKDAEKLGREGAELVAKPSNSWRSSRSRRPRRPTGCTHSWVTTMRRPR
jgi:hypothetical protein